MSNSNLKDNAQNQICADELKNISGGQALPVPKVETRVNPNCKNTHEDDISGNDMIKNQNRIR